MVSALGGPATLQATMKQDASDPSTAWFREEMRERLRRDFHEGDWSIDPWWLRPSEEKWFSEHGWPLERRTAVVPGLRKLYPASICRELLVQPWRGGLVYFLFARSFPWFVTPFLKAAED